MQTTLSRPVVYLPLLTPLARAVTLGRLVMALLVVVVLAALVAAFATFGLATLTLIADALVPVVFVLIFSVTLP